MMQTEQAAMTAQSVTNGWDAVLALNAGQVNAIFLQQYLQQGPTAAAIPLRVAATDDTDLWLLDGTLGPPNISFATSQGQPQCRVRQFLVRGTLARLSAATGAVSHLAHMRPNTSWLDGAVDLKKVQGTVSKVGDVVLDLAAGSYTPQLEGIDPSSTLATELAAVVTLFFKLNSTPYQLGTVMESEVPASLQPTSFEIVTQAAPGGGDDGCVQLLIKTSGGGGTVSPLAAYPIPAGSTAALLVSNQTLFQNLMPDELAAGFTEMKGKFTGQQVNGAWQSLATEGALDLGVVGDSNDDDQKPYSTNDSQNPGHFMVGLKGLMLAANGAGITISFDTTVDQKFVMWPTNPWTGLTYKSYDTCKFHFTYSQAAAAAVDPTTDVVSFTGTGTAHAEYVDPSWWVKFIEASSGVSVPQSLADATQKQFGDALADLTVPHVNTFALANLLFPSTHVLTLDKAAVPCDLVLTGQIRPTLVVTPDQASLAPAASQQFTATRNGQAVAGVQWAIDPPLGSIDSSKGLYTAPDSVSEPQAVMVTALDSHDTSAVGRALVLIAPLAPAGKLLIAPGKVTVTPGQSVTFNVRDQAGKLPNVNWTVEGNQGVVRPAIAPGQWIYQAPDTIAGPVKLTLTATNAADATQSGSADVHLLPTAGVTISPATPTVSVGQSVQLTASATGLKEFNWFLLPTDAGSVKPDPNDSAHATFTPAANATAATIIAYGHSDDAVGSGVARISITV